MAVKVNHDEDADVYELGDTIDGVFVTFLSLPGSTVRGRVESVKENAKANASESGKS